MTEFQSDFKSAARTRGKIRVVKVSYVSTPDADRRLSRAITMLLNGIIKSNEDKHLDNRGRDRKG